MNILPKKRWHTRNKDNVARVRRDQEEARKKELDITKRTQIAQNAEKYTTMGGSLEAFQQNAKITPVYGTDSLSANPDAVNEDYVKELKEKEHKLNETYKYTYLESAVDKPGSKSNAYKNPTSTRSLSLMSEKNKMKQKLMLDPLTLVKKRSSHLDAQNSQKTNKDDTKHRATKSRKKKSLEQLRQERLQREQDERIRAQQLLKK